MNAQTTKPESGPVNGGPLVHSPVRISLSLDTLPAIREYCGILAKTAMVPRGYVGKADDILVAIMHGFELGLPPLQALQSIATINGIPSIYGDAALALVRRSEKLEEFDEWIEVDGKRVEGPVDVVQLADGERRTVVAFCRSKRIGMVPRTTWFSVADAKRAHLWLKKSKDGVESPWCHYPQRMLMWRARGWNLRDNYGDVLKGLAIAEEALDIAMAPGSDGVHRMAAEVATSASPATESAAPALPPPTLQPNGQAKGDALLKKTGHLATPPAPPAPAPEEPAPESAPESAPEKKTAHEEAAAYQVLYEQVTALVQKYVQTAKGSALLAGIRKQLKLGADVIPSDGQTLGYFYKLLQETEGKL